MKKYKIPVHFFVIPILVLLVLINVYADWNSFRGNPQLTGVAESQLPDELELLWTFKAGDIIESTAAVVDDVVYVGSLDGILYAIDANSGKSIWTYNSVAPIKSSPSVEDGVVYFGDGDGIFHAVDIASREMKWKFESEGEIVSSANISEENVLFGSYDGFLYCLNKKNGDLIWKYETEGYVHGTPGVWTQTNVETDDRLNLAVVTGCDSYLRVINIADGKQIQQVELGAYVGASPAIFMSLSDSTKQSDVQAFCGTYGNEVLGVDLMTGKIIWNYENPDRQLPFFSSAAVTEDIVIIGGRDKVVHAISPEEGEPLWTFAVKSRIESSPVIVDERVFLGTTRGTFIALNIADGEKVWEFDTTSSIYASPSVADGKIYIGTEAGILYCFGEK